MSMKVIKGPYGLLDEKLHTHVEVVFAGENLLQMILHGHLLLERALDAKIAQKFARPSVLEPNGMARLSFAQKVAIFVGLYDPSEFAERMLIAFNKLRNAVAHDLVDLEAAVNQYLRPAFQAVVRSSGDEDSTISEPAKSLVVTIFGGLMLFELGALHGVQHG